MDRFEIHLEDRISSIQSLFDVIGEKEFRVEEHDKVPDSGCRGRDP